MSHALRAQPPRLAPHHESSFRKRRRIAAARPVLPSRATTSTTTSPDLWPPNPPPLVRPIAPPPPPLDDLGLVPRCAGLALEAVDPRLRPLLSAAAKAASSAATGSGSRLLGVYLRGSVPRGLFIEGVSDVDFIALVADATEKKAASDPRAIERAAAAALAESTRDSGGGGDGDGAHAAAAAGLALASKVELRVHVLSARDARLLEDACAEAAARPGGALPPSLVRRVLPRGLAFELATGAVPVLPADGGASPWPLLDLPALLPDVARLPPAPSLLPTVAADVRRAVAAARGTAKNDDDNAPAAAAAAALPADGPSPRAAARWALKRCVRAALELQFCSAQVEASRRRQQRWTRDLYHCAALTRAAAESGACPLSARVADAVDEALRMYVSLLLPPPPPGEGEGGGDGKGDGQGRALVAEACAHAERLADALDAAFLAAMLGEAPGWLTRHGPAGREGAAGPRLQPRRGKRRAESWWPFSFGPRDDADAGAEDAHSPDNIAPLGERPLLLVGCDPPPVYVRLSGPARLQFDWGGGGGGAEGLPDDPAAAALGPALAAALMLPASSAAAPPPQPVLLRGFAKDWPATRRWSFLSLLRAGDGGGGGGLDELRGKARAAPSLAFPFCEPTLRDVLVAARGPSAAPSLEVDDLPASEFVRAMLLRQTRTSAAAAMPALARLPQSWGRPYLYMQADLPEAHPMRADVQAGLQELLALLSSSVAAAAAGGGGGSTSVRFAQAPRLWASARGSVSPTHFDRDSSLLVQVVGRKRMLLFDPEQLECLRPYPPHHLLRRRARVNLAAPEAEEGGGGRVWPLRSRLCAIEVLLEPGDAIFFPASFSHHTESLSPSMSVTARFVAASE